MPAQESKPVDPAVQEADEVVEEATEKAQGKQVEVESESEEEDDAPADADAAASTTTTGEAAAESASSKKKKKSKRKKIKEALSSKKNEDPARDIKKAIGGLSQDQVQELLALNPALAQELGAAGGSGSDPSAALKNLNLQDIMTGLAASGKNVKDMASYKFWSTQPVPKFDEADKKIEEGPLKVQTIDQVPKEPPAMVSGFEWVTMDLENADEMKELYELLNGHYVEDDEAMFRFNYSVSILKWALMAPGWKKEWHVGVRATQSRKLVAFISAIPVNLQLREKTVLCSEVNFICVHKKLRGKRLAPVLIKEVTRRSNLNGIWQGLYTAGVVLPTPVSTCRYYHRAINWQKLYEVGFSPLPANSKPQYQVRKYQLPEQTNTKGLREIKDKDVDSALELYTKYMQRFKMWPKYNKEEFIHWFIPKKEAANEQVIWTYVVENDKKEITDMFSFYCLESSVINNAKHNNVRAAYLFYYATTTGFDEPVNKDALKKRLNDLVHDALILSKRYKFDVFNALSLMDNGLFLQEQKFGPGDGQLHFYLYNYRANPIPGGVDHRNRLDEENLSGIGLVML